MIPAAWMASTPRADLLEQPDHLVGGGERSERPVSKPVGRRRPGHVFHHEIRRLSVVAERVNREGISVRDARHSARFVDEQLVHRGKDEEVRVHELDRDCASELLVDRKCNDAHPSDAQHALDSIRTADDFP